MWFDIEYLRIYVIINKKLFEVSILKNKKDIRIGKSYYSFKTAKALVLTTKILAIALLVLGLLLCIVTLILGIPTIAIGIFMIFYSKSLKKVINSQLESNKTIGVSKVTTPETENNAINLSNNISPKNNSITNSSNTEVIQSTDSFEYPSNKVFFFVDVETATRSNDTICAIGAIIIKNGEEHHFHSFINPQEHITNTSIHGISDNDVADAPKLNEYWSNIVSWLEDDYIVVGHNVAFDISVLSKDLERYSISFNPKIKVDTMAVAKDIYYNYNTHSGDLKLNTLCDRLNICLNHHNAESDIAATKQVLERLLTMGKRDIDAFINVHYSSPKDNVIGNVRKVSPRTYWNDIEIGKTPAYFTNWKNVSLDTEPQYDEVELSVLQYSSMMDRTSCGIQRIVKQIEMIKNCVESINGKIYGKGAKTAKCYIEFYYMDIEEYKKLKAIGYKIYHALDVEYFINNNQDAINEFISKQEEEKTIALAEKEKQRIEREEKRAERERKKQEQKENPKKTTRRVTQMNDDGEVIKIFESLSDAVKTTGTNSKSIRDCCNGIQKHAGGFVWRYTDEQ